MKKYISSRIFPYFPKDKEKVFFGESCGHKSILLKLYEEDIRQYV